MEIEAGKFYRVRDGRVVGPLMLWDENDRSKGFRVSEKLDHINLMWDENGKFDGYTFDGFSSGNDEHAHLDLVEEAASKEHSVQMAWADIAALFDTDTVRRWARVAATIVDEMPAETAEDAAQIAAYNKLRRGLEHIIASQDKAQ